MKIKHNDIEPPIAGNPFANCKLGRQKYANVLTNIVELHNEGFVLAINNKWGTGKTTFIKMWEQDLKDKDYQTIYFNAWENDFENNPLIALMGELKTVATKKTETKFKDTLKKAGKLTKNILPIVAKAVADKYINSDAVKDGIEGLSKGIADIFENDVNEYAKKKKSITEFKQSLSEFVANTSVGNPLIFIIDELDRCRPNYAVSILEQIKHFFSVPNIIFVLSIDKVQLGNAVRGVYGSDKIDANEYLRRFIDIEYSIPEPEASLFSEYLYDYFNFDEFFKLPERSSLNDKYEFINICKLLFTNIPLRQQEKIFSISRLALRSFKKNSYVIPEIFIFLTYLKNIHNDFYENLRLKKLTIEELQEEYASIISNIQNIKTKNYYFRIEIYLVNFYYNFYEHVNSMKKIFEYDPKIRKNILSFSSKINEGRQDNILQILENMHNSIHSVGDLNLGYFINKIELLDDVNI